MRSLPPASLRINRIRFLLHIVEFHFESVRRVLLVNGFCLFLYLITSGIPSDWIPHTVDTLGSLLGVIAVGWGTGWGLAVYGVVLWIVEVQRNCRAYGVVVCWFKEKRSVRDHDPSEKYGG